MKSIIRQWQPSIPSGRIRGLIVEFICYAFVGLFIYTVGSKLQNFSSFDAVLSKSPLIGNYHLFFASALLSVEIAISALLIIPVTKKLGLYASLVLMVVFTIYVIYMVMSGSKLPCYCGGVISSMTWHQHIWFNLSLSLLAGIGAWLYKK